MRLGALWSLHDLSKDVAERNDVAADHPEIVAEMAAMFLSEAERTLHPV
jgi:hypothetical protein